MKPVCYIRHKQAKSNPPCQILVKPQSKIQHKSKAALSIVLSRYRQNLDTRYGAIYSPVRKDIESMKAKGNPQHKRIKSDAVLQENISRLSSANKLLPLLTPYMGRTATIKEPRRIAQIAPVTIYKRDSAVVGRNAYKPNTFTTSTQGSFNGTIRASLQKKVIITPNRNHKKTVSTTFAQCGKVKLNSGIKIPLRKLTILKDPLQCPIVKPVVKEDGDRTQLVKFVKDYFASNGAAPGTTLEFYKVGKPLGKGGFGKVHLALHKLTGKLVAVKFISKELMKDDASKSKILNEIGVWEHLIHPNIIQLYETFESDTHLLYVQEVCLGGDLLGYVRKRRRLNENVAKHVLKQLLEALCYVKSKQIVHRDIKLDNLLLTATGCVKVCDFGVSRIIHPDFPPSNHSGTPAYSPPEAVLGQPVGFPGDMWSAGVVLYSMLYGTVPFKGKNIPDLGQCIVRGKFTLDDCITDQAKDLIIGMLQTDPKKRLTPLQALQHKWLASYTPINLFTEEEKVKIAEEFDLSNLMNFVECQTDLEKNITTKSVIFAPFNTTRKSEFSSFIEFEQARMKLGPMVREADAQYERNYNHDVDNGVYNDARKDLLDTGKNAIPSNICPTEQTSIIVQKKGIDEKIVKKVEELGYPKEYTVECLENQARNHATTIYNLLLTNQ